MEIGDVAAAQGALSILNSINGAGQKPGPSSTTEPKEHQTKIESESDGDGRGINIDAQTAKDAPQSHTGKGVGGNLDLSA